MRRRANSIAARINVALASPTPSNCDRSSAVTFSPFSSMSRASFAGQRHHVHARRAFAEQHGQQFLIAQCLRAFARAAFLAGGRLPEFGQWSCSWVHAAKDKWVWMTVTAMMSKMPPVSGVFGIGQFLVTSALVVGCLNLAVDLAAIRAFEDRRGLRGARGRCCG